MKNLRLLSLEEDNTLFHSQRGRKLFIFLAFLLPFVWLCVLRPLCMPDGENANDAYYHIGMAERGIPAICAKNFPQLELSVWKENFADKEFLYHVLLCGLVKLRNLTGSSGEAPYHFPAMFFTGLALAALIYAMIRLKIAPALLPAATTLAVLIIPNATFRIYMLRPHVLSLALMLLLCGILSAGTLKFRIGMTLLVSFIYTWSYSNPQFILIPAVLFSLAGLRQDSWKSLWISIAAAGGVVLGLLIHPQFPHSFIIWKVQSFDALFGPLFDPGLRGIRTLLPPMEMLPPDVIWHRNALPLYIFGYMAYLTAARIIAAKGFRFLPIPVIVTGLLALLFTGGSFIVQRTMEYAAVFMVLFGIQIFDIALKEKIFLPGRERPFRFSFILTALALLLACYSSVMNMGYIKSITPPAVGIGKWMEENLPENEVVINLNWGDFPPIFQANRKQIFLWGMDPAFSIARDPRKTRKIETLLLSGTQLTPRNFLMQTRCRYAFVLAKRDKFIQYMKRLGWQTVYEAEDGCIFTTGH